MKPTDAADRKIFQVPLALWRLHVGTKRVWKRAIALYRGQVLGIDVPDTGVIDGYEFCPTAASIVSILERRRRTQ